MLMMCFKLVHVVLEYCSLKKVQGSVVSVLRLVTTSEKVSMTYGGAIRVDGR